MAVDRQDGTAPEKRGFSYRTRRTQQPLTGKRHRHVTVDLGQGRIAVFAGFGKQDVQVLNVRNETFQQLECKRWFADFNGISLGENKALLVDGKQDCVFDLTAAQFIPTVNTFTGKGARWPAMLPLSNGSVFLCGGLDDNFKPVDDGAVFDLETRRFRPAGKLRQLRSYPTVSRIARDRFLVVGGRDANSEVPLDTLEVFDLSAGKSEILEVKLKAPRYGHGAAVLPDGTVLLAGGRDARQALATAEIIDLAKGTTFTPQPMGLARHAPQMAALPSGRVAVFGGRSNVRVVEVYCPAERQFALAGQLMVDARSTGFTATRLEAGGVLLVGGRVNDTGEEVATAEIFTETESPATQGRRMDLDDLVRQLGDKPFAVREAAMRKLIEMGPDIAGDMRALLKHDDPEIRARAAAVLNAVTGGSETPKWCVEVWRDTRKEETLWFDDYSYTDYKKADDGRILDVEAGADKHKATHVVVRFPETVQYSQKAGILDLIGWARVSIVYLGETL